MNWSVGVFGALSGQTGPDVTSQRCNTDPTYRTGLELDEPGRFGRSATARVVSVVVGIIGLVFTAGQGPAGAHFADGAVHHARGLSIWMVFAIGAGLVAVVGGMTWLSGPLRLRSLSLRLGVVAGVAAIGLAACGSATNGEAAGDGDAVGLTLLPAVSGYEGPRPDDEYAANLSTVAAIAAEATGLPDLISDPPVPRTVQDIVFAGHRTRVVRFDGYVTNAGPGILDMFGDPTLSDPADLTSHTVWQRIWTGTEWEQVQQPPVRFESADGHDHFHLMEIARYSMWDADKRAQVAPGEKVGFCLFDSEQFVQNQAPAYLIQDGYFCRQGAPLARVLRMGISPGWRDLYAWDLPLQWVDASNVVPGEYWLAAESDPFDQVLEADETNNGIAFAESPMVIPGYNAEPSVVDLSDEGGASPDGGVQIELAVETIGEPIGDAQFRVTRLPTHGQLLLDGEVINDEVWHSVSESDLTYVADGDSPGNSSPENGGPDSFEFEVIEADLLFPLFPQRATVVLVDAGDAAQGDPAVAIGGHRATIYADTMVQVTASSAVQQWTVDGIAGGNESVGTIDETGLYIAPVAATERTVVIGAEAAGASASVEVHVAPRPNRAAHIEDPIQYVETGEHSGPLGGPTVERVAVTSIVVGEAVGFMVPVLDADGDAVTVRAEGLPPGLTLDPYTAVVAGIATKTGSFDVTVFGDDGNGESSHTFPLTVDE